MFSDLISDIIEENKESKVGTCNFNIENKCILNEDIYSNNKSKADNFIFLDKSTDKSVNLSTNVKEAEKNIDSSKIQNSSKNVAKILMNCNQKSNLLVSKKQEHINSVMKIDENNESGKNTTVNFDIMVEIRQTDETEVEQLDVNSNHNNEIKTQLKTNIEETLSRNDIDCIKNSDQNNDCKYSIAEIKNNNSIPNSTLNSPCISEKDDSERIISPLLDINITHSLNQSVGSKNFLNSLKSLELAICNDIAQLDMPLKESTKALSLSPQMSCVLQEKHSDTQMTLIPTAINKHHKENKTQVFLQSNNGFKNKAEIFENHAIICDINILSKESQQYTCQSKIADNDCEAKENEKKEVTYLNESVPERKSLKFETPQTNLVHNNKKIRGINIYASKTDTAQLQNVVGKCKEIDTSEFTINEALKINAIDFPTQINLVNNYEDVKNSSYESDNGNLEVQIETVGNKEIIDALESTIPETLEKKSMELQTSLVNRHEVDFSITYESKDDNQQLRVDENNKIENIDELTPNEFVENNSMDLQTQNNLVDKFKVGLKNGTYESETNISSIEVSVNKKLTYAKESTINEFVERKPIECETKNNPVDKQEIDRECGISESKTIKSQLEVKIEECNILIKANDSEKDLVEANILELKSQNNLADNVCNKSTTDESDVDKVGLQINVDETTGITNLSELSSNELLHKNTMQLEPRSNLIDNNKTDNANSSGGSESGEIQLQNKDVEIKCKIISKRIDEKSNNNIAGKVEVEGISPEMKCHNKLIQNVKESHYIENGYHDSDSQDLRDSDDDFDIDAVSVNSEDSVVSLNKTDKYYKRKLRAKPDKPLEDPEFLRYLEMRQDSLIDENPGLTDDEIISYLYKTYLYEESQKSDFRKTDDIEQSSLVKGVNASKMKRNKVSKSARESFYQKKKKKIIKKDIHEEAENTSATSDSDVSLSDEVLKGSELVVTMLDKVNSKGDRIMKITKVNKDIIKPTMSTSIISQTKQINITDFLHKEMKNKLIETKTEINIVEPINEDIVKEVKELNAETASIGSEDMDMPLIFRKSRAKVKENVYYEKDTSKAITIEPDELEIDSKRTDATLAKKKKVKHENKINYMENPEFVQYLELRQDVLIEENPQLRHEEVIQYLYKTWLFEEEKKSEQKKADDLEQSGLVKGLKQITDKHMKIKKKLASDKTEYENIQREKPRRKASKPFYNEEYTDLEDELEFFEIFKQKPSKVSVTPKENLDNTDTIPKSDFQSQKIDEAIQDENEAWANEVEFYFEQLTKPKPNIFKGLIREKVCEICETANNLIKCKSCHGMFHIECVKKLDKDVKTDAPIRGRKKRRGRKPKNLEDSESQSDEKCLDISEELNVSIEENDLEPYTVDANAFENQLSVKMKEILDNLEAINYDSYSSDDGIDWIDTVPGKCEIVDVKLKKREKPIDYSDFKCNSCRKYDTPVCFVCKSPTSKTGNDFRQKCNIAHCNKYYHVECLDHWPQTQFNAGDLSKNHKKMNEKYLETLTCPRHVCHTCVSDDPRGCKTRFSGDKLAKCVRCPATYHSFTKCLPAGSKILTGSNVICPRHYEHR